MKHLKLFILVVGISFLPKVMNAQVRELTQRELYEKVLNSYDNGDYTYKNDKPCVVLFFNPYCPYSRQMETTLATVANKGEFKNEVNFYKINIWKIDDNTLEYLGLEGAPSILFMDTDGEFEIEKGTATTELLEDLIYDYFD